MNTLVTNYYQEYRMNIIEITSLAKDYANNGMAVKALRDVALSIGPGEFTAIAGPPVPARRRC